MNKREVLIFSRAEMYSRRKSYVDVAWFFDEVPEEQLETIQALRQLEQERKIQVTDRAPGNIISCFTLA